MRMRSLFVVMLAVVVVPVMSSAQTAADVIEKIWENVGGKSTYENTRYVQFTWEAVRDGKSMVTRTHTWDRFTGTVVYEMVDGLGYSSTVIYDINNRRGSALVQGRHLQDTPTRVAIAKAYRNFINDTYWLLVPVKLEDPGVFVTLVGDSLVGEETTNVLNVAFDPSAGLTPGDQYWLYVTDTGRIVKWRYLLEGGYEGGHMWSEPEDCGNGLKLSCKKTSTAKNSAIVCRDVLFTNDLDPSFFEVSTHRK